MRIFHPKIPFVDPKNLSKTISSAGVNPVLKPIYDFWSFHVIPPMGQVLANDWDSYQYFVESIRKFPEQEEFKLMIESVGFEHTHYKDYTLGICSLHQGFKL